MDGFDLGKFIEDIEKLLARVFGQQMASYIIPAILLFTLFYIFLWSIQFLIKIFREILDFLQSFTLSDDQRKRIEARQRFAEYIELEIRKINNKENWKDHRYTELEAEVEAEGKIRFKDLSSLLNQHNGIRREESLSKAIETSNERLILLEGTPGAGKSVALRQVAQKMAERAKKANKPRSIIPIYVNLREIDRSLLIDGGVIDHNLIENFILQSLNKVNDREVETFLEEEFNCGLKEGTWFFLFDSFDEIPDVLNSTEADDIIQAYTEAISDFLQIMNKCRGIIASRHFRGPKQLVWPRFRILPLSEQKMRSFIKNYKLPSKSETDLVGRIGVSGDSFRFIATNPMFLGLLCEYIRIGNEFPKNAHDIFENYISNRLDKDRDRLSKRFNFDKQDVRIFAEHIAFCMAIDQNIGLNPSIQSLQQSMKDINLLPKSDFDKLLRSLEYIKIARTEDVISQNTIFFTFAHRRFQEYFATCFVLKHPERVNTNALLTNARWRETAVVICQAQPLEDLNMFIDEARDILNHEIRNMNLIIDDPIGFIKDSEQNSTTRNDKLLKRLFIHIGNTFSATKNLQRPHIPDTFASKFTNKLTFPSNKNNRPLPIPFHCPSVVIHILGILQDGFSARLSDLPEDIRLSISKVLLTATVTGQITDRKWSLELVGTTLHDVFIWILRDAFASKSQWLKGIAYKQASRLSQIPSDIATAIRKSMLDLLADGRFFREKYTIKAHISRLSQPEQYLQCYTLILSRFYFGLILSILAIFFAILPKNPLNKSIPTNLSFYFLPPLSSRNIFVITLFSSTLLLLIFLRKPNNRFALFDIMIILGLFTLASILMLLSSSFLPGLFYTLSLSWMLMTFIHIESGKYLHPSRWIFILISPILYLLNLKESYTHR